MSTKQIFLILVEENGKKVLKEANGSGTPIPDNTTVVERRDKIEWLFEPNSGIASIISIDPDADDLFYNLTTGEQNGWIAEIDRNAPLSSPTNPYYSYTIQVSPVGNVAGVLSFDPKMRVISPVN
jgi:hypothetical protein